MRSSVDTGRADEQQNTSHQHAEQAWRRLTTEKSPSLFLPKPNVSLLFHSSYKMRTFWLCKWSSQTCTQYSSNTPTFFLFSLHFLAPSLNPPSSLSHDAFCSKPIHPNGALKTLRGTLDDDSKPGLWKLPDLHSLQRRSWTREERHSFIPSTDGK